jgi:hypothetical protein
MKPLKILILAISLLAACKKDKSLIKIEGFHMTDPVGNDMGHYGAADDDWTFRTSLSAREMALFDFPVTATLDNTAEGTVGLTLAAYPNPTLDYQNFTLQSSDSVLLKLVIVNDNLEVLGTAFHKFKNAGNIRMDYSDHSKFPERSSLRVYYSLSAQGKPNFKTGYGDIRICYADAGFLEDCF